MVKIFNSGTVFDPVGKISEEMATHPVSLSGNPTDRGIWHGYSPQGCKEI